MNILMITGSPRRKGTTARLADAFAQGAENAGHRVAIYHAAFMDVVPCKACYGCKPEKNGCVIKDDMTPILGDEGKLLRADAIVFVTPVYYFGMTAQLKAVLDRIYAVGRKMREKDQKLLLITAAGDTNSAVMDGLKYQMRSLRDWTHWKDGGTLVALGCHEPEDLDETNYLRKAYEMGYYI